MRLNLHFFILSKKNSSATSFNSSSLIFKIRGFSFASRITPTPPPLPITYPRVSFHQVFYHRAPPDCPARSGDEPSTFWCYFPIQEWLPCSSYKKSLCHNDRDPKALDRIAHMYFKFGGLQFLFIMKNNCCVQECFRRALEMQGNWRYLRRKGFFKVSGC